jgi:hypothetical protein
VRTMYDSTTAADIPADAEVVAGYVDGKYAWSPADWARFPNAVKVRITVFGGTLDADVLDVEPGDATAQEAADWVRQKNARGERPTIYCGGYNRAAVDAACRGLAYDIWLADPNGIAHLAADTVATQYAWRGANNEHYDMSLCADWWPRGAVAAEAPAADPLIGALAYVCDDLGDKLDAVRDTTLAGADAAIADLVTEIRRVRVQFLGERAA